MRNIRYNLLTSCIVSALHPNEPAAANTKWEPTNAIDIQEAEQLTLAGYAEVHKPEKGEDVALTRLQREAQGETDAAPEDIEPGATVSDDELAVLGLILDGSVEAVAAELVGLSEDELRQLDALETAGKNRKGVHDAIAEALDDLEG